MDNSGRKSPGRSGALPPFTGKVRVDRDLILTCENFRQTLDVRYRLSSAAHQMNQEWLSSVPEFPTPFVLAQLAKKVYKNENMEKNLHAGWHLLTAAYNNSNTNGYFGAAYWNPEKCQVVISHRGSDFKRISIWWTDVIGIVFNCHVDQMHSASTFAAIICAELKKLEAKYNVHFQVFFTGHSLGGWLAQITTFTTEYLEIEGDLFQKPLNAKPFERFHAHTVVFESPGCKEMLSQMKTNYDIRYHDRVISLKNLDITTYLSAPNIVNTYSAHVGTLYRIFIANIDPSWRKYTISAHNIKEIAKVLLDDGYGKMNVQTVLDWPIRGALDSEREYNKFFEWAMKVNCFHPQVESIEFQEEMQRKYGRFPIRYQTKAFVDNQCSVSVFTLLEQEFLERCQLLRKCSKLLPSSIGRVVKINEESQKIVVSYLENFEIRDDFVTCSQMLTLPNFIPLVKLLLQVHRNIVTDINSEMVPAEFNKQAYRKDSDSFCQDFLESSLQFKERTLGIKNFLDDPKMKVMQVTVPNDMRTTTVKVHKTVQNKANAGLYSYCTVLPWQRLLTINQRFVSLNDFLNSVTATGKSELLVIECEPHQDTEFIAEAEALFKNMITLENISIKLIVITQVGDQFSKCLKQLFRVNFPKGYMEIQDKDVIWNSLELCSQQELQKMRVSFQREGENTSLEEFVKIQNMDLSELFDKETVTNFVHGEPVTIGREQLRLIDLNSAFVELCQEIPILTLKNYLCNWADGEIFLICCVNGVEGLLSLLKVERQELQYLESRIFVTDRTLCETMLKKLCHKYANKRIHWIYITAEKIVCQNVYDPELYFKRNLKHQEKIVLLKGIFDQDALQDVLVIEGVESGDHLAKLLNLCKLPEGIHFPGFKDGENAENIFDQNVQHGNNVHWLKVEQNGNNPLIIWHRSHGSLEMIRKYINSELGVTSVLSERDFLDVHGKIGKCCVILGGEPGMGKSTTLTSFTEQIKSGWVIRVDLKDCHQAIVKLPSEVITIDHLVEFFTMVDPSGFATSLAKNLLKCGLEGKTSKKIHLLFDGFDEIRELDRSVKKVINLLRYLQKTTTVNILITTREYPRTILEDSLGVFASSFTEISKEEQQIFLERFWKVSLSLYRHKHDMESKISDCAKILIEKTGQIFDKDMYSFMGIPLQMRMLAEVFQPRVESLISMGLDSQSFSEKLPKIQELYKTFIDLKYDLYYKRIGFTSRLTDVSKMWLTEVLTQKHRSLAFAHFFPKEAKQFVDIDQSKDAAINMKELNHVGLIQSAQGDNNYSFLHRSFAEYFTADVLVNLLRKPQNQRQATNVNLENLLMEILLRPEYKVIRLFLDGLLTGSSAKDEDLTFYQQKLARLWSHKPAVCFSQEKRTVFHILTDENLPNITKFLSGVLRMNQDKLLKLLAERDVHGETALYRAVKGDNLEMVEELVNIVSGCPNAAKLSILLGSIFRRKEDETDVTVKKLLDHIQHDASLKEMCTDIKEKWKLIPEFLESARNGNINGLTDLLDGLGSDEFRHYLLLCGDANMKTALHNAAENGHAQIVDYLVREGALIDSKDLNEDIENFAAIHYAVSSGRYDVVRTLVEQKADINSQVRCGMTPLHWAAKCSMTAIAEFLIDNKADVNIKDKTRMTAFACAAKSGNLDTFKLLFHQDRLEEVDRNGMTALHHAVKDLKWNIVNKLVEKGANVNTVDWNGKCPIARIVKSGNWKRAKCLLTKGVKTDVLTEEEKVALLQGLIPKINFKLEQNPESEIVRSLDIGIRLNSIDLLNSLIEKWLQSSKITNIKEIIRTNLIRLCADPALETEFSYDMKIFAKMMANVMSEH